MKTGALIVTTGTSGCGSEMESMLQIGSVSIAQRLCMTFHLAGVSPIVVVVSQEEREALERHLAHMQVIFLSHSEAADSLFSGIKTGLSYLDGGICSRVLITPVNVPMFSVETVKALLAVPNPLAVPVYEGHRGHPLLVNASFLSSILQYDGEDGVDGALRQYGWEPALVEVEDPGVYVTSDQFAECEKIVVGHNLSQWRPVMKLRIARESAFFGPGSWQLLSLIETTGSVRTASGYMGISYSKAWKLLNNLEEQAGYHVLTRKKGGRGGGGATSLTVRGKLLMEWYERMEQRCNSAINVIFSQNPPPQ